DFVVVYGDTNSTLAGALAAKKLHIQVVHIEAGLRSFNMDMPEEVNRILTDRISDILFCPTMTAVQNLKMEGFEAFDSKVYNSGDIMYDAALFFKDKAANKASIYSGMDLKENEFILATIHRQENTDNQARLRSIINALNSIHRSKPVIVPLHPRTQSILKKLNIQPEFRVIEPVGYLDMIALTSHAYLVLTDSGGLQKEAYFFGKYCITLRDQTEWVELVNHGLNQLTGADEDKIWEAYQSVDYSVLNFDVQLYGDGQAAQFIIEKLRAQHKVIE
ncbi:MAG: UDP-N-acetylglucosamine 2-epimerase (non-hydrolyzing), partial [Chitinophagales bacterium]|nr:UDP-N-acetylglucosamine 2-epimerase (non-hydrolyzing) [Chitinophagales bacterium]